MDDTLWITAFDRESDKRLRSCMNLMFTLPMKLY
jgi:hypothetical protein